MFSGPAVCMSGPSKSGAVLATCRTQVLFKNVPIPTLTATLPKRGSTRSHCAAPGCTPHPAVQEKRQHTLLLEHSMSASQLPRHALCVGRPHRKKHIFRDMKCPYRAQLYSGRSPQGPDLQRPGTCTSPQTRREDDAAALTSLGAANPEPT